MEQGIVWVGSSLEDIRDFPKDAAKEIGYNLNLVQNGETPDDQKTMRTIGVGVKELRVHLESEYRTIYVANRKDEVEGDTKIVTKPEINMTTKRVMT